MPSSASLSGSGSLDSDSKSGDLKKVVSGVASGSSDSDKTSSQSSQPVVRRLKYEMCKNWREKGNCKYGDKCLFAHGTGELTKRSTVNGPEPAKPAAEVKPAQIESKEAAEASQILSKVQEDSKSASDKSLNENANEGKLIELTDSKIMTTFDTPAKADSPTEIVTPAFSSQQDKSTQQSTGNGKLQTLPEQTFSKLSAIAQTNAAESYEEDKSSKACDRSANSVSFMNKDDSLIEGDLNYLLDREIQNMAFVPKPVLVKGGCSSTNNSSTAKSPLAAYADSQQSYDFYGRAASKKAYSTSQRSSFDDSLNNMFSNDISLANEMRMEVSPGKIGDGLFAPNMNIMMAKEPLNNGDAVSNGGLSSEEETLIAQSNFELQKILADKAGPGLLSRFQSFGEQFSDSELEDSASQDERIATRRLRIFHDITQRQAGRSNDDTQQAKSSVQELQD